MQARPYTEHLVRLDPMARRKGLNWQRTAKKFNELGVLLVAETKGLTPAEWKKVTEQLTQLASNYEVAKTKENQQANQRQTNNKQKRK